MNSIEHSGDKVGNLCSATTLEKKAARLSKVLHPISAQKRITRVLDEFGSDVVVATSFGLTSAVLLHMVSSIAPGIRVINIKHGFETLGTLEFERQCLHQMKFHLREYQAPRIQMPGWATDEFERFCEQIKVEPMLHALKKEAAQVWLAGLIHDETTERRRMQISQVRLGAIAVYPILDWCFQDAVLYCASHGLALNRDYFDPCKGPEQKLECGLHAGSHGADR